MIAHAGTRTSWKKPGTRQAIEALTNKGLTLKEAARSLGITYMSLRMGIQKYFPELTKGFVSSGFYNTTAGRQTLMDALKISNDMDDLAKQLCVSRYNARQLVKCHFPQIVDCLAPPVKTPTKKFYTVELCEKVMKRMHQGRSVTRICNEFDLDVNQYQYIRRLNHE